jgi:hypothetical protein
MPSFEQVDHTFFPTSSQVPVVAAPLTGATLTMGFGQSSLFVNAAGTLAALTVKLPPSPVAGQIAAITPNNIITALTVEDSAAGAITGSPTAGVANTRIVMQWVSNALGWKWIK